MRTICTLDRIVSKSLVPAWTMTRECTLVDRFNAGDHCLCSAPLLTTWHAPRPHCAVLPDVGISPSRRGLRPTSPDKNREADKGRWLSRLDWQRIKISGLPSFAPWASYGQHHLRLPLPEVSLRGGGSEISGNYGGRGPPSRQEEPDPGSTFL